MPGVSDFGFTMRPSRRELVLVVADDAVQRSALAARLQEDGYSVLSAATAEEAMAMLPVTRASVLVVATARLGPLRLERPIPAVFVTNDPLTNDPPAAALTAQLNASRAATAAGVEQICDAVALLLSPSP